MTTPTVDEIVKQACLRRTLFDALAFVAISEHEIVKQAIIDTVFKGGIQAAERVHTQYRLLIKKVLEEFPVQYQYSDLMDRMEKQGVLEIQQCTVKEDGVDIICPHCSNGDFFELPVSTGLFVCMSCHKKSILRQLTR